MTAAAKRAPMLVPVFLLVLLLAACSSKSETASPHVEITISAAASLTDALNELKTRYEHTHANTTLVYNFGASGALQQQIEQGAPADLFLSAASNNMQALVEKKLIRADQERNLLKNELVVVIPASNQEGIKSLQELQSASAKRIAIGIPESVPAGKYAKEALMSAKLWDELQPKLVQGKDVRQVLQYVETGNADAGFVYKTDAMTSAKAKIAFVIDPAYYSPISYPVGIVSSTKQPEAAEAFYAYLSTEEAQAIFIKYGFSVSP
ncbi:molybdenum ABC transporter, periplasmic molybdate-binding protein [Paenibacillus curdlanolyticus YK9]|uniref:Molybdenum ABC transporter, periplasmic molybdate-binding protein n=1 Tax=Paenibacillus curdlanolyticus YK9 TaxID=717606 RepID=E0IBX1_9BACL|nr:molybdate ABC transporter substrate-binding protein [Paenibacillus curdlanolyticus]EFM10201.1 molybdenum ABC transporter, periplasmic molybdate-binding protein [Paenibacillus curdlanolyticus YK9]